MSLATRVFPSQPTLSFGEGSGSGPVLLLLHGVTRCWRDWDPLLPLLADRWRVLAVDFRGHGESEHAKSYLVSDYVADTGRFVRDHIGGPVVIHGHSLGAMVAAAVAAEFPQYVSGVVLEDPPFHTMGDRIHGTAWQAQFSGMRAAALRRGSVDQLAAELADIALPMPDGRTRRLGEMRDANAIRWSASCLAKLDPEVLSPLIEGRWLDGYDPVEVALRVRCPAHLLQADRSAGGALSDEDARDFLNALHDCRHERFAGAGHLLHWQHPQRVADAVNTFLRGGTS